MNDRLKELQNKAVDFWNKYDKKQKRLIISISITVVVAVVILAYALTRPAYKELITCEDLTVAASVKNVLVENQIDYKTSNGDLTFLVKEADLTNATYLIAQEGYTATDYTIEKYAEQVSGFSTTSADRERYYLKYLEDKMRTTIKSFDYVKDAYVQISTQQKTSFVIDDDEETYVSVNLQLKNSIDSETAEALANYIRTAVGNSTTEKITILDSKGNLLFRGKQSTNSNGGLTQDEQQIMKQNMHDECINKVTGLLANTQLYSSIEVAPYLKISFTTEDEVETTYFNDDNVKESDYVYEQEGGSTTGGIPGTDSNDDDTDYMINLGDSTNSSVVVKKNEYKVSSRIISRKGEVGVFVPEESKISVTLSDYVVYNQDELKKNGSLDDITWEEFKEQNSAIVQTEVEPIIKELIATATGIDLENITVYANKIPVFEPSAGNDFATKILPIILAVITLFLLGFIVWRSLRPVEVSEVEPELSVEELLSATKEKQKVEDIDYEEKSETGRAIERFIEENPEAAAALLRNWLNEDWN